MDITRDFIANMAKPVMVIEYDGSIVQINEHGYVLLEKTANKKSIDNIREIDADFKNDSYISLSPARKSIYIKKLKLTIDVFQSRYEGDKDVLIYIFNHILFNKEIVNIFNQIGDVIDIANAEGIVEAINDAVYPLTGSTRDEIGVGSSLPEQFKKLIISEPAYFSVMKEKKPIIKRITYASGVTLLNRGYPIFTEEGEIERVIIFGQNISELSTMEERLILSERNRNEYMMKIDEVTEYFNENHLVFSSDSMKKIINTAIRIAPSQSSVFIWGESGVGKEVIAKIIHNASSRKKKPFIAINCAAIPSELFESELFGYEKGAFTGANKFGKSGLLEEANGGTIFLDELGELPYAMQSKLLRAIQENKIRRVGGTKDITINAKYISATNLRIEQILNNEHFRRDLYYRLSVIPINVPPLRARREDIIPLLHHFLDFYNEQMGKSVTLSKKVFKKLINYNWPGNVRELKNTTERIIVLAENNLIDDLDMEDINMYNALILDENIDQDIIVRNILPIKTAHTIVENSLVQKAYKETGSIVKTAHMLGINPSTIHRKIKSGEIKL